MLFLSFLCIEYKTKNVFIMLFRSCMPFLFFVLGWVGWCEHRIPQGYTYYNNYFTKDSRWSPPPDFQVGIGHLNRDEVQVWANQYFLLFTISHT